MLTLKKVKELVGAPSHAKRTPSPKMLYEEGIVLLRREFDQGSHLTVYNSGYVLFSAGKRNTVFHIHDCCGDYAYDAAEGKGDVIEEEYFENCEWHIDERGLRSSSMFRWRSLKNLRVIRSRCVLRVGGKRTLNKHPLGGWVLRMGESSFLTKLLVKL